MRPWFSLLVLFLSVLLRAEMPVSSLTFGPAPESQTNPQLAANGDCYLAIWSDYRELPRLVTYATRLDADGNALDPQGIRLGELALPIVKSDGERWIVIDNMLTFIAIDRDGHVVERRRIVEESTPSVLAAFNGREFLLVWFEGNSVRSALVDRDGRLVTQPATLPLPSAAALAFNGSRFLLIYPTSRGVWKSSVLDANGTLLSSERTVTELNLGNVSLAASNGEFVGVWRSFENARAIVAARFDAEGNLALGPASVHGAVVSTKIASDGRALTVYFVGDDARLMAFPLSRDLVAGSDEEVVSRAPLAVRSFAADGALAVADVYRSNEPSIESELYASRPGQASWRISGAAPSQREPAIAAGARSLLVVREENRGAGLDQPRTQIEATYVDRVTGASTELVVAPSSFAQTRPSVAVIDDVFFVTWRENFKILGRLIRDGAPGGEPVILQTEADSGAVVTSDGRDFLALWWDWERYTNMSLKMARISTSGEVVARSSPTRAISDLGTPSQVLACTPEECLLVWRDFDMAENCPWYRCAIDSHVKALRVDAALQPIDAEPLVLSGNDSTINHITVAAGDGAYAVAWSGNANRTITARTLDRFGPGPLLLRSGHRPNLVRQGEWWLLVHDSGEQLAAARFRSGAAAFDVPLQRDEAQSRANAALAPIGANVAVVYERSTRNEPAGGVPRIYIDTIAAPKAKTRAVSFR